MAGKKLSFEQSMARLDEIVRHLEKGDMPLNDSLLRFSRRGRRLSVPAKSSSTRRNRKW